MNTDNAITDYWHAHYCTIACTLCGNSGVLDTTGVCTAAGVPVGRRNYCICPNGQVLRRHEDKRAPVFAPCHCGLIGGSCTCKSQTR